MSKKLSKKQFDVIEALFDGDMNESTILDDYGVSRRQYHRWQTDPVFTRHLEQRLAVAQLQGAVLIARYAPLAAAKLVQLTESEKEETARKACLDIISMRMPAAASLKEKPRPQTVDPAEDADDDPMPEQLAARILAVLAEEDPRHTT